MDTDITDSETSVQGFSVIRLGRSRCGGVLMHVKTVFTCSLLFKGTTDLECIVSILCTSGGSSPDFAVGLFYKPPNSNPTTSSLTLRLLFFVIDVSVFCFFFSRSPHTKQEESGLKTAT